MPNKTLKSRTGSTAEPQGGKKQKPIEHPTCDSHFFVTVRSRVAPQRQQPPPSLVDSPRRSPEAPPAVAQEDATASSATLSAAPGCYEWNYKNASVAAAAAAATDAGTQASASAATVSAPQPATVPPAGAAEACAAAVATVAAMEIDDVTADSLHSCRSNESGGVAGMSFGLAAERCADAGPGPGSERLKASTAMRPIPPLAAAAAAGRLNQGRRPKSRLQRGDGANLVHEVTGEERLRMLAGIGFVLVGGGGHSGGGRGGSETDTAQQQQEQQVGQEQAKREQAEQEHAGQGQAGPEQAKQKGAGQQQQAQQQAGHKPLPPPLPNEPPPLQEGPQQQQEGPQQQQQQQQHEGPSGWRQPHRQEGPGSWQQPLAADAVVFLCDLAEVLALGADMKRTGRCPAALRDLTGRDFVVVARLPPPGCSAWSRRVRSSCPRPPAPPLAGGVLRYTPLVVCRQLPPAAQDSAHRLAAAFAEADAAGVFEIQRRSANKTAMAEEQQQQQQQLKQKQKGASGKHGKGGQQQKGAAGKRGKGGQQQQQKQKRMPHKPQQKGPQKRQPQTRRRQVKQVTPTTLGTTGWVWSKTTPTCAPGHYQHLRDPVRGPARLVLMRHVMALMSALLDAQHPRHMAMIRAHCKGVEPQGAGTGPFCSISYTSNYHNRVHFDQDDPPLSFITWLLVGSGELAGGAFRLGNLHLRFTPLHGTTLLLNTQLVAHGTEPCATVRGDLRRIGSAAWVRHSVVQAVARWRVGAARAFARVRTRGGVKGFADAEEYALARLATAGKRDVKRRAAAKAGKAPLKPRDTPTQAAAVRRRIMDQGAAAAVELLDWEVVRAAEGCWDVVAPPLPGALVAVEAEAAEQQQVAAAQQQVVRQQAVGNAAALLLAQQRKGEKRKQAAGAKETSALQRGGNASQAQQPQQQQPQVRQVIMGPAEAAKQRRRNQMQAAEVQPTSTAVRAKRTRR